MPTQVTLATLLFDYDADFIGTDGYAWTRPYRTDTSGNVLFKILNAMMTELSTSTAIANGLSAATAGDIAIASAGVWNLSHSVSQALKNPGGAILGTDPGGAQLVRVGGSVFINGAFTVGQSGAGQTTKLWGCATAANLELRGDGSTSDDTATLNIYPRNSPNTLARAWALRINYNSFGDLEFMQSTSSTGNPSNGGTMRAFFDASGNFILGTDPGGPSLLRVGGAASISGNLFALNGVIVAGYGTGTSIAGASAGDFIAPNNRGLRVANQVNGTTYRAVLLNTSDKWIYDADTLGSIFVGTLAVNNSSLTGLPFSVRTAVGVDFLVNQSGGSILTLNAVNDTNTANVPLGYFASTHTFGAGPVIVGTDPGGAQLLRIGGSIAVAGGNILYMGSSGFAAPTFTTRSAGTKIVLYDALSGSAMDYALGVEGNAMWFSTINAASGGFKWYGGTTVLMSLFNNGGVIGADPGGTQILRLGGGINISGGIFQAGSQVVGARATGWTLPTGTLSRGTFDQATVTLAQLAQRVAALITDMYSNHGLINA